MTALIVDTVAELQDYVKQHQRVRVQAGGSKTALSRGAEVDVSRLAGISAYNPSEYTITAQAGTGLAEMEQLLAVHGQYLPFDPVMVDAGASLAGSVAAGLSGSGRFRYGGVRDFLLGVSFVSGEGQLHIGGSKVVKNAAGFDLPKLMVGSLGQLGILTELTFKVFPKPETYQSLVLEYDTLAQTLKAMQMLAQSSLEVSCLDIQPTATLVLRLGGAAKALPKRMDRIQAYLAKEGVALSEAEDAKLWQQEREFAWLPEKHSLIKIPINPQRLAAFDFALERHQLTLPRRYAVAGNVIYLGWDDQLEQSRLETLLRSLKLSGLAISGNWPRPLLGEQVGLAFLERLRSVLDPESKFSLPE